jgi:hypothetical protein
LEQAAQIKIMKTATEQFIEDAIAGGWSFKPDRFDYIENINDEPRLALLDPLAWQAVGKTRGWSSFSEHHHSSGEECNGFCIEDVKQTGWKAYWHRFIDHLADSDSIDDALAALD